MIFIIYTLCACISVRLQDYYMIRRPKLRGAGQELTTQGRGRGVVFGPPPNHFSYGPSTNNVNTFIILWYYW